MNLKSLLKIALLTCVIAFLGCSKPLSQDKLKYVGLWKNNETELLITQGGRLKYESQGGSFSKSFSGPIKSITDYEIKAGILFFGMSFRIQGPPKTENGKSVMIVDGKKLYKALPTDNFSLSQKLPSLQEIESLVHQQLSLFSLAILSEDFSHFISQTSVLFQSQVGEKKLAKVFSGFVEKKIDLKEYMKSKMILSQEPSIDDKGVLKINGFYDSKPDTLKYELTFIKSSNQWKLLKISISLVPN